MKVSEAKGLFFKVAGKEDDESLRKLSREVFLPGWIRLSFEREPNFFDGALAEGFSHQTLMASRGAGGEAVAMISRSIRKAYLNGVEEPLGYLHQLRFKPGLSEGGMILRGGARRLREFHRDHKTRIYLVSLVEGNSTAERIFKSGLKGFPFWKPLESFSTLLLTGKSKNLPVRADKSIQWERGSPESMDETAEFLNRQNIRFQLAPLWTGEDLTSRCTGLKPADFLLARQGGRIIACAALWDQRGFKQNVVRGYAPGTVFLRPFYNLFARWKGLPLLPPVGAILGQTYISHLAAAEDDSSVVVSLLLELFREKNSGPIMLGLASRHPFLVAVRKAFCSIEYRSLLGVMGWEEEDRKTVEALDQRVVQAEAALL